MFTPGDHLVRVKSTELGRTSSGKEQLAITFTDGENTITAYRFFTEAAIEYTEKDLQTLGWDPVANGWEIDRLHQTDLLLNREVEIHIEEEYYKDKRQLRVKFINTPGQRGLKDAMSVDEAMSFASNLRSRLMGGAAPAAPARQPAPAAATGAQGPDDDLPF